MRPLSLFLGSLLMFLIGYLIQSDAWSAGSVVLLWIGIASLVK